jgi:probable O-glycosylation ligase (exosortase A-associated)
MRDIVFTIFFLAVLPTCFRRPYIGLLMFSWLAYMRTQDLLWNFGRYQRWSFIVAIVMFAGWFVHYRGNLFPNDRRCWAMVGLIVCVGIGLAISTDQDPYLIRRYVEFCKVILIALFTAGIVTTYGRLRMLVWTIALSFGFYGVKCGLAGVLTGGSLVIKQGPGGMLEDNNDFSLALCMAVPLLIQISRTETNPHLRRVLRLITPLTMLTVLLTYSRGGFLSLSTVLLMLMWRSRNRVAGMTLLAVTGIVAFLVLPDAYKERLGTIVNYQQDGSAMGRLKAWKVAIRMALDNPVFGVGLNHFQTHYLDYIPAGEAHGVRVAHNSYLQIWAEAGSIATALYLYLIAASLLDLWAVRRMAKERYYTNWILNYATMFETSLVAFTIGGIFLNRAHFDLFYHFVAMVLVFGRLARAEMSSTTQHPLVKKASERGELQRVRARGFDRRPVSGFERKTAPTGAW